MNSKVDDNPYQAPNANVEPIAEPEQERSLANRLLLTAGVLTKAVLYVPIIASIPMLLGLIVIRSYGLLRPSHANQIMEPALQILTRLGGWSAAVIVPIYLWHMIVRGGLWKDA